MIHIRKSSDFFYFGYLVFRNSRVDESKVQTIYFRMRKLERIAQLDSEVGQLKEQNMQLVKEGDCLRGELRQLKDILRFAYFFLSK